MLVALDVDLLTINEVFTSSHVKNDVVVAALTSVGLCVTQVAEVPNTVFHVVSITKLVTNVVLNVPEVKRDVLALAVPVARSQYSEGSPITGSEPPPK